MSAAFLGELFRGGQQGAAQLPVLQIRPNAEEAEIPDSVVGGIQPDGSEKCAVGFIPMNQQVRSRLVGQIFSEQRIVETLPLDDSRFGVPTGARTGTPKGDIDEVNDLRVIGFNGRLEQHSDKFTALRCQYEKGNLQRSRNDLLVSQTLDGIELGGAGGGEGTEDDSDE
jgi:hypothetical protein